MIANDPQEMRQLTEHWAAYLATLRLKLLLYLNSETVNFLTGLQFKSCEENYEQVIAYNLSPFYDVDIPEYKIIVELDDHTYELAHFNSPPSWQINSQPLQNFFALNPTQANFLADILNRFDLFAVLARIRTANRIARYKEKFLRGPLIVTDVVQEKEEFYLVLDSGDKVKIVDSEDRLA